MNTDDRYQWIDSLKGISILGVIMIHSGAIGVGGVIGTIGKYGSSFVQAFLVISSFLVWKSLGESNNKGQWFINRIIKLIPAYYVAIVLYLAITGGSRYDSGEINPCSLFNIVTHVFFVHGFFPKCCNNLMGEWYLGVLVIFYFIAPILHKYVNSLLKSFLFFVGLNAICNYLCIVFKEYYSNDQFAYIYENYFNSYGFLAQFPTLSLGIILYYALLSIKPRAELSNLLAIILSFVFLLCSIVVLKAYSLVSIDEPFRLTVPTLYGVAFSIYLLGQSCYSLPILNNKILGFVGMHSWGMYIFHPLFLYLFNMYIGEKNSIFEWLTKYFLIVIISIIVSAMFNKITKEFIKLLHAYNACN